MTKQLTFTGIDFSNEISLLEYGLLVSNQLNDDGSNTRFCVFRTIPGYFDVGHISEAGINGYILGKEFPDENQINGFLSFVGLDAEDWVTMSFASKLYDLLQYWGYENIIGTSFIMMSEYEAIERYL